MTVVTPTVRTSLKRTAFWSIGSVVAILVAIVLLLVRGVSGPGGVFLSASNPAPGGAMALVEVLQDQGVTVEVVDTRQDAEAALEGTDATLLLHDADAYLEPDQLAGILPLAAHAVLVEPAFSALREVVPEVSAAGAVDGVLNADCDIPAVRNAGAVLGDGSGYRLTTESTDAVTCLGSGDDVHSLIQVARDGHTVTVLGASAALTNEHIAEEGNAALALTLLGEQGTLVWYQPTLADVAGESASIADLTPEWLSPVLALMFLVVIAAGIWRGMRLGPLAVEHLPVTVPANETMDGRARLYQKASARLRALDALRVGTVSRLAAVCGLPPSASVAEVAAFTASVTGRNLHEVRRLLLEAEPATDRELITLSDDLLTLEKAAVRSATGGDHRPAASPTTDPGE